jgi:hypothetical protein
MAKRVAVGQLRDHAVVYFIIWKLVMSKDLAFLFYTVPRQLLTVSIPSSFIWPIACDRPTGKKRRDSHEGETQVIAGAMMMLNGRVANVIIICLQLGLRIHWPKVLPTMYDRVLRVAQKKTNAAG